MYLELETYKKIMNWLNTEIQKARKNFTDACGKNGGLFSPATPATRAAGARLRYLNGVYSKIFYNVIQIVR